MAQRLRASVSRHTAFFRHGDKDIAYHFWVHNYADDMSGSKPDTVIFLGTGQVGVIPKWVAMNAPSGVVVVEGLPQEHIHPSADDLIEFSLGYAQHALGAVRNIYAVDKMHIIGTSQSAPGVIWLANHASNYVRNVVLLAPMGLNTAYFGETDDLRVEELKRRAKLTFSQSSRSLLRDTRNVYIIGLLIKLLFSGWRDGSTVNKYAKGIAQDMLAEFRILVGNSEHQVTLLIGDQDRLFPAHEVQASLRDTGIDVRLEVMPGIGHSSLALRATRPLLTKAVEYARFKL